MRGGGQAPRRGRQLPAPHCAVLQLQLSHKQGVAGLRCGDGNRLGMRRGRHLWPGASCSVPASACRRFAASGVPVLRDAPLPPLRLPRLRRERPLLLQQLAPPLLLSLVPRRRLLRLLPLKAGLHCGQGQRGGAEAVRLLAQLLQRPLLLALDLHSSTGQRATARGHHMAVSSSA